MTLIAFAIGALVGLSIGYHVGIGKKEEPCRVTARKCYCMNCGKTV